MWTMLLKYKIIALFAVWVYFRVVENALVYPQSSTIQFSTLVSVPIEVKRKIFVNWGIQVNYDLPNNESTFANVPFWPFSKRSIDSMPLENSYENYNRSIENYKNQSGFNVHSGDLSAGEFYSAFEDLLWQHGYHDSCLLKSVCEYAQHPITDEKDNMLTEIIGFVLSPSIHDAFGDNEVEYKESYENAEFNGLNGRNCDKLYPRCKKSMLELMTKIIPD